MVRARWIITLALIAAAAAFAGPKLSTFLPASNEIPGWVIASSAADRAAYTEKALYDLYDGDVPHLKKFGLTAAHQRMYKSGSKRAVVDLMQLDNYQHAKALYAERTDGFEDIPGFEIIRGIKEAGVLVPTNGVTIVYFWQRNYLCSISVFGTTAAHKNAARAFARKISAKIKAYYAPKKKKK